MLEPFADPVWAENHGHLSRLLEHAAGMINRTLKNPWTAQKRKTMARSLEDQTVLVIGGGGGIGAAVARRAQEKGASVIAVSRSGTAAGEIRPVAADVLDLGALERALSKLGKIDHLVHTAGARAASTPMGELDPEVLSLTFATKLFSALHAVRFALPHLAESASITLTSGQVSRKYGIGSVVKGSVNAAVEAAGRHLAKEVAPRRVNVISPGVVDTGLWGEKGSERRRDVLARAASDLPVRRHGTPDDLADAYLFAMTNTYVTGAVIDVDGGGLL